MQIALRDLIAWATLSVEEVQMVEDLFVIVDTAAESLEQQNYPFLSGVHTKILSSSSWSVREKVVLQVPVHFSDIFFCTYVFIYAFITKYHVLNYWPL